MNSPIAYYFSKWTFVFTSLFIIVACAGIIYFSLLFYPDAWQYSLLFASPLLIFLYILPEYLRTFYFLVTKKPVLLLTKNELIDNFKRKKYKWSDIENIELKINEGKAPGYHIALYLNNSEEVIDIPDIKLKGKQVDILDDLIRFHRNCQKEENK